MRVNVVIGELPQGDTISATDSPQSTPVAPFLAMVAGLGLLLGLGLRRRTAARAD